VNARRLDRALIALAVAYYVVVLVDVILRRDTGLIHAADLGSSPTDVAKGELERLLSSALVVEGPLAIGQIALTAGLTWMVVARHGPRAWWGAAVSGHVGSALVAYALIALAVAAGLTPDRVEDQPDFGISAVLAATAGALSAGALRRGDRRLAFACLAGLVIVVAISLDWYGIEHPLAFALGAAFLTLYERRRLRVAG
jgi:hypothetical protein